MSDENKKVYYITPTQYKVIKTFIDEDDNDYGDKITNVREQVAKKLKLSTRTVDTHMHNIEFTLNTNNKFKIARLFLENRLIPIDKMREKKRWQNLRTPLRDL